MNSLKIKNGLVIALIVVLIIPVVFVYASRLGELSEAPEISVFSRDIALQYIVGSYPELSQLVDSSPIKTPWYEENPTPDGWARSATVRFTICGWTVKVSNAMVPDSVYIVEVESTGSNAFCWKGIVDKTGTVYVIEFSQ